jgi:uncharacterized membrane protein
MNKAIVSVIICLGALVCLTPRTAAQGPKSRVEIATFSTLPSLPAGGPSEALGVADNGTVIVGTSWDRYDVLRAVKWSLQNGSWVITALPHDANATSAITRSVNNQGDAAGNDFPGSSSHPVLWPATGGYTMLGCADAVGPATVYGISSGGQTVAGQQGGAATLWEPGTCGMPLPPLFSGASAGARTVNGDGTIVGGAADPDSSTAPWVPARWRSIAGLWQIEQLDARPGAVRGANGAGDLAGYVSNTCALVDGCQRAVIWYAAGGSFELGTLGGEHSLARDINGSGEVVGMSTAPRIGNTAFFWSATRGMLQLPFKGSWAAANAISDVRPDGTRLVAGMSSQGNAMVWVVR